MTELKKTIETPMTADQLLAVGFDEIIETLNKLGIKNEIVNKDKYGFSRTIQFKVYDITYRIIWFVNQSTLTIGEGKRPAQIPFKYIYFDNTFPLIDGNKSLGFSFVKFEKKSIFDRQFPYEVFRIPLELS